MTRMIYERKVYMDEDLDGSANEIFSWSLGAMLTDDRGELLGRGSTVARESHRRYRDQEGVEVGTETATSTACTHTI